MQAASKASVKTAAKANEEAAATTDEDAEATSLQIACPSCALRGSSLPVLAGLCQGQCPQTDCPRLPSSAAPGQSQDGPVRQNRASRLRQQRSRQLNYPKMVTSAADLEDAAIMSMHSSESDEVDGENKDADSADPGGIGGSAGNEAVFENAVQVNGSEPELPRPDQEVGVESFDSNLKDTLLQSVENSSRDSILESADAKSKPEEINPTTLTLNMARLNEQLSETSRQRQLLKDRIASLAKMVPMSRHVEQPDNSPMTQAAELTVKHAIENDSADSRVISHQTKDEVTTENTYPSDTTTVSSAGVLESRAIPPTLRAKTKTASANGNPAPTGALAGTGAQRRDELVGETLAVLLREAAEECAELRLSRESLRHELEVAKFDRRIASAEAQERRVELTQSRRQLDILDQRIAQMSAERVRAEKEAKNLHSQLLEMRRQVDSAENSRLAEIAKNLRFKAQQGNLEAQLESRMSELTSVTNALIEKRRSEDELLARNQQLQRALASSEETVKQLTEQLTAEQAKIRETLRDAERSRRPLSPLSTLPEQSPEEPSSDGVSSELTSTAERSTVAAADVRSTPESPAVQLFTEVEPTPAGTLEQRMAELDARIGRLVAEARSRGWRRDDEQRQQLQVTQDGAVTSTPRSPVGELLSNVSDPSHAGSDGEIDSLKFRTAQLETSNRQLVQDVQALRQVCSQLLHSRQELKRQVSQFQVAGVLPNSVVEGVKQRLPQPTAVTQQPGAALSNYLFATETLRAMINKQMQDFQNSSRNKRRPGPLSGELNSQQETVNKCWQTVQLSFQAETQAPDPGAYRDFYLKRNGDPTATKPLHSAALLNSMRPINSDRAAISTSSCDCRHSKDCPLSGTEGALPPATVTKGRLDR